MKKSIRILLALLTASVLLFAACSKEQEPQQTATSEQATSENVDSTTETQEPEAMEEDKPFGKYEEPLEVHFVRSVEDTLETNVLANLEGDQTVEDNIWTRVYEDELNIKIVYDWIVSGSNDEYQSKLNVALASGDIPDLLGVNATQMVQLIDAGMIQDLSGVFQEYSAPLTTEVINQDGDAPFLAGKVGDQVYGLPNTAGSIDNVSLMWIRTDWLEDLGLEVPTNMDELVNMIDAFTNADFDGNGEDDTVGLAVTGTLWDGYAGLQGFFNAYQAYPNIWIEKDGKLEYGSVQPEVRDALVALNEMFEAGYIDPTFGVKDGGQVGEAPANGLNGFNYGQQWNSLWPLQSGHDNYPDSQWTVYPIVSATDKPAKAQIQLGTSTWWVANKDFEHPEALVKMFNVFIEKCWGETGDNGVYYAPPYAEGIWKLSPLNPSPPFKNLDAYLQIREANENGDTSVLTGEARSIQDKLDTYYSGSEEGFALWGWERIYTPNGPSSYSAMEYYEQNDLYMMDKFVGAPTPTMVEKKSTLDDMQNVTFLKIILGEAPIEDFDKFVEDFMDLGGTDITAEVNEWYDSVK
jgi:putative aldouronate transport system substrate-binding protein